jgi:hypothetical protein
MASVLVLVPHALAGEILPCPALPLQGSQLQRRERNAILSAEREGKLGSCWDGDDMFQRLMCNEMPS